jgi:PIN domain nuclease of toxin-antitoxin system
MTAASSVLTVSSPNPLLLDSNVVVWLNNRSPRLPATVIQQIRTCPQVYVSAATAWELGIKQALSRLTLTHRVSDFIRLRKMTELSVTVAHGEAVQSLPLHHRDPFDRLLVAQAMVEGLVLVTADKVLLQYGIPVLLV